MTPDGDQDSFANGASAHEILMRLDLAVEVLEGMDELGIDTRAELEALVERLERRVADAD
jgi:hypothetical protein